MKYVFSILLLVLGAVSAEAQNAACPKLSVIGPAGIIRPGELAVFSVNADLPALDMLKFEWTTNTGTIESGLNSPVIFVRTRGEDNGITITAVVTVRGLPDSCPSTASAEAPVSAGGDPPQLDSYWKLSVKEELARLDAVAMEWQRRPAWYLYFIVTVSHKESRSVENTRIARIKRHLSITRKISPDRLVFVHATFTEPRIQIYLTPPEGKNLFN